MRRLKSALSHSPLPMMRSLILASLIAALPAVALAGDLLTDGPVSAGGFGMSGADYYGDVRSHMPFTGEPPPRPLGIADVNRVRAARHRSEIASRRHTHRRIPQG
ncbi:MAG: hypothetical protein ABW003_14935 [Microvirga sp.]